MVLPMFLILGAAVFAVQLVFCFCAKKLWIKLLPAGMAVAGALICWGLYFSGMLSDSFGGEFAAVIYGIVMMIAAVVAGSAWGIYGIVQYVQNRRK